MRNLTSEAKAHPNGVNLLLKTLGVSNPELVQELEQRRFSSRGNSSGCDNTHFTSEWNSWDDTKN